MLIKLHELIRGARTIIETSSHSRRTQANEKSANVRSGQHDVLANEILRLLQNLWKLFLRFLAHLLLGGLNVAVHFVPVDFDISSTMCDLDEAKKTRERERERERLTVGRRAQAISVFTYVHQQNRAANHVAHRSAQLASCISGDQASRRADHGLLGG